MLRFRGSGWNPRLLVYQILALQSIFYVTLGSLSSIFGHFTGRRPSLHLIFSDMELRFRDTSGKCMIAGFLLTSVVCGLGLWCLVKRSKQCLDFSCTIHFWHLVACIIYNFSFPTSSSWWLTNVLSIAFMTVIGEYLCMQVELKEIPINQISMA